MVRLSFQIIRIDFHIYFAVLGKETGGCECSMAVQKKVFSGYGDFQFLVAPMVLQEKEEAGKLQQFLD